MHHLKGLTQTARLLCPLLCSAGGAACPRPPVMGRIKQTRAAHAIGTGDKSAVKPVSQHPLERWISTPGSGAKKVYPVRQAAWNAANAQAKRRITDFENAVKPGNADRIRKATSICRAIPAVQH